MDDALRSAVRAEDAASALVSAPRGITTARLSLRPVGPEHLADLIRLKADERVFGAMLHGVRTALRAREEAEDDAEFWLVRGYGTWSVFERETGDFLGIAGFMERPDGRGVALRYALWPECRGKGYAREAARAALAFGHAAGLGRIVAVARETNIASRSVLTDIGMTECGEFRNLGHRMLVHESVQSLLGLPVSRPPTSEGVARPPQGDEGGSTLPQPPPPVAAC